jgi:phosphatidylglycerophosphate synthase
LLAVPAPSAALVWLPALLHAAVILPDPVDGALARWSGRTSLLGMHLDMEYDSVGMLAGTLLVVRLGHVPWWFALVGLARYLYVAALWWHRRRGLPVDQLTHSTVRRVVAGLMMGFVNVALWPVSEVRLVTLAAVLLSVPHLGGFTRDWLVVSGAVDPAGPVYRRLHAAYQRALYLVMPVLRILGAGIAIAYFAPSLWRETGLIALAVAVAVAGLFLGIGAGARLAALALLIVLAVNTLLRGAQPRSALLIIAALPVLLYGPGALAIWPVDEPLFTRRA